MRTPPAPLLAALLTGLLVLTACSDDGGSDADPAAGEPSLPPAASFTAGTCALAAEDVRAIGELLPRLGEGPEVEQEVLDALQGSQDAVRTVAEDAEPAVGTALEQLSQAVGFVRIRGVGNTYEPALGESARTAYDEVVAVCTGPAPTAAPG